MKRFTGLCLLVLLLVAPAGHAVERLAMVGGTLVDGTLSDPIRNSVILIEDDRIVAVGTVGSLAVPADAKVISTDGMTVLPGLWDMHVHLMLNGHSDYAHWDKTYPAQLGSVIMPASARQLLMAGVTGARDLGGPLRESIAVRDAINQGTMVGPRCSCPVPSSRKRRMRVPSSFAGACIRRPMHGRRSASWPTRAWTRSS